MAYNRYRLPPDFSICRIHIEASLPLFEQSQIVNNCPCCQRFVGSDSIPLCTPSNKLIKIGQQIPLYFMYITMVGLLALVFSILLIIQYYASNSIEEVQYDLELPTESVLTFTIGYVQTARWVRFIYFLIFALLILAVRAYLKKIKYEGKNMVTTLSDRSIMLTNVHPKATAEDIKQRFSDWDIDKVVFTYRVRDYFKKLVGIYSIKKEKILATKQGQSKLKLDLIQHRLDAQVIEAERMSQSFRVSQNQLDIVFLTFHSASQRDVFLEKYETSLLGRLYYKFCTCCSGTDILGQHVTVKKAPQPEDIDWLNLQHKYWTKKIHRIACYYMCFAILIYGVMFQYEISIGDDSNFTTTIIRTVVVFVGNFAIITLLQYTTNEIEKHELNSNKVLSLVKKLTFFVFLNLSMSPLLIYIYNQFMGPEGTPANVHAFDDLCFSVLTISLGNIFKPLSQFFNVQRIIKFFGFKYQRSKGDKCQLTQEEAHLAFEPIPFPLASFYSLLISSIFMTAFFLSCFQVILVVQLLACSVLFITSKYMLLKVCKEPVGFKDHIGRLSQRLLTVSIYIYWFGDKIMYFCIVEEGKKNFGQYLLDFGAFGIIEIIIMVLIFLFSSTLIAKLMKRFAQDEELKTSLLKQVNRNTNQIYSYEDVNAIKTLEEEYKKILEVK